MKVLLVYKNDKPTIQDRFPKDTQFDELNINTPFEIQTKDYDVIYCDCLEAYEPREVPDTLKKLYDVLKVKGELWLSAYSFEWAANQAFVEEPHPALPWVLFGPPSAPHRSTFTMRWMRGLIEEQGLILRTAHEEKLIIGKGENKLEIPINFVVGWKYEIANPAEAIQ